MNRTIEVIVAPDGSSQIETKGFVGNSCQAASRFLEQALGVKTTEKLTAEFFAQQASHEQLQEGRPS